MRRHYALLPAGAVAACLALPAPVRPQDPGDLKAHHWPHRTVGFPVTVEKLADLANKPSELQLYYSVNRSAFQKGPRLPVNRLDTLANGQKGFLFDAPRDGDYELSIQFVYPDGSVSPKADELAPQQRVVVDTTPPVVRVVASGNGVRWQAADENLDPQSVKLQCKWPTDATWTDVKESRGFRAADGYSWNLAPGKALDVRVRAADRAGNEGVSAPVRVPADGAQPVGFPKGPADSPPAASNPNLPAARVDYVNTPKFDVDFTVQGMGRSGVRAAHLFVIRSTGGWDLAKRHPVTLMPSDKDRTLSLPYEAADEGTYGFYVVPESGAGNRGPDPKKDDPPMVHVVVDKTPPYVLITGVQVRRGGARGPVVEITWKAADPNLMPEPVSLEWSPDPKAAKWNEVKYRLRNDLSRETGRFAWEIPDDGVWKFYVRARAVDKASNTGEHVWGVDAQGKSPPAEVIVDLETPSATINRVRGANTSGDPQAGGSSSDAPAPPKKNPPKEPAKKEKEPAKKDSSAGGDPPKPDSPPLPELPPGPPPAPVPVPTPDGG